MKNHPLLFLFLLALASVSLAWTLPPEFDATPTPLPVVGNTRLAPDLTAVQNYETPTPEHAWNRRMRKTEIFCELNADNLTYLQRLECGRTPEVFEREWEKKTEIWLEQCWWRNQPPGTPCPSFPLKTANPYKYTVTPEPLS